MMRPVDVREATHVKVSGVVQKIATKYGISADGKLAKPSEGGFGVTTESGRHVNMYQAEAYFKEELFRVHPYLFKRLVLMHPTNDQLAWSGSRWVKIGGRVQICNFKDEAELAEYVALPDMAKRMQETL